MNDSISRRDAINAVIEAGITEYDETLAIEQIKSVPAQPEQQWIPVSERLPEDEYVLISKKPTKISGYKWCVTIAVRMEDPRSRKVKWMDIGFGEIQDDNVLAWMPLPECYRGENDG